MSDDLDRHAERGARLRGACRLLRHDAARRRADGRRRARSRGEARARPRPRRARHRADRGGLSARLRRRLARGGADLAGRPARRDLGVLPRGAGRPGGPRRARRERERDRVADLRPQAGGARRLARRDAAADHERRRASPRSTASTSRSSASTRRARARLLRAVYRAAVEAGAREVVAVDTIGVASPEAVGELVGRTREWVGADVPVHFHGHNDFGLATASAVAAARAGARWIHGTINGMGERAGNANLAGDRARAARPVRRRDQPPPRPRASVLRASARRCRATSSSRTSRSPGRTSSRGSRAPSRASFTTRRRSSRTRRPWSARSAESSSARRAASPRSASRRASSGSS